MSLPDRVMLLRCSSCADYPAGEAHPDMAGILCPGGRVVELDIEAALKVYLNQQWAKDGIGPLADGWYDEINGQRIQVISNANEVENIVAAALGLSDV